MSNACVVRQLSVSRLVKYTAHDRDTRSTLILHAGCFMIAVGYMTKAVHDDEVLNLLHKDTATRVFQRRSCGSHAVESFWICMVWLSFHS